MPADIATVIVLSDMQCIC